VLDPHGAYDPPEGFDGWYREEEGKGEPVARDGRMDPPWVAEPTAPSRIARYDGEIASDDHWIGALRDQLRSTGIDETTLLAMIADHGEHLGEHGLWEHHPPGFQQVLHVPMVLRFPKHLPAGVRVSEPVGLIDLAPTLLELVGVDPTALPFQGRSLVARARGEEPGSRLVVSEEVISYQRDEPERVRVSLFFRGWHLLRSRVHGEKSVWAYRFAEDPEEVRPLPTLRFDPLMRWRVVTLMRQLKNANLSLWAELSREAGSDDVRLDPETQDQLRALGYID
jgi:arylsulfatase A-like enzyme